MKKHTLFIGICLIFSINFCFSQNEKNANHWLNTQQNYLKFTITKSGIYRIAFQDLKNLPEASSKVENIQIFYRGQEIPKRIIGLEDGKADDNDYIEWYGKANDGSQDSLVYRPHSARPPVDYNLYSNETSFFITVGSQKGKNIRNEKFQEKNITPEAYHLESEIFQFSDEWSFNNSLGLVPYLQQSYYERGENWTGKFILRDSIATKKLTLTNYFPSTEAEIRFKALLNGRNYVSHIIHSSINNQRFSTLDFFGFDHFEVSTKIEPKDLDASYAFSFATTSPNKTYLEAYSWSKLTLSYPQSYIMNQPTKIFYPIQALNREKLLSIRNAPKNALVYDISDIYNTAFVESKMTDNQTLIYLSKEISGQKILVSDEINYIKNLQKISFESYPNQANYLIITHKNLLNSAKEYATYRASEAGGKHQVLVADVQQLYDQFNYGERSPIAIRNFLTYQLQNSAIKNRFLLLLGQAVSFPDVLKAWADRDLVPTWGYPASDNLLSAGLNGFDENVPAIPTGRLNVTTNQQVINYLTKVKEFELQKPDLWRKKVLHLNGGQTKEELNSFKSTLESLAPIVKNTTINGEVEAMSKQTTEAVEEVDISKQLNEGIGMISFIGHASPTTPDFNIGLASKSTNNFKNKAKYPLMYFNGCGVGNIFYRYETLSTDWLLTPDKGSIVILANSFWSYTTTSANYLKMLYKKLFDNSPLLGEAISLVQQATIADIMSQKPDLFDIANAHQVILQGDPAIKIFAFQQPDYTIQESNIRIESENITNNLGKSDKIRIKYAINNLGKIDSTQNIPVIITLKYPQKSQEQMSNVRIKQTKNNTFELVLAIEKDLQSIDFQIDKENKITESNKNNNTGKLTIDWKTAQSYNSFPLNIEEDKVNPILQVFMNDQIAINQSVFSEAPKISFSLQDENPLKNDANLLNVFIQKPDNQSFIKIESSDISLSLNEGNLLSGIIKVPTQKGIYKMLINGQDLKGNYAGNVASYQWEIRNDLPEVEVSVMPNPASDYIKFVIKSTKNEPTPTLSIYNVWGQICVSKEINLKKGVNEVYIENKLNPNTYFYQINFGDKKVSGKIVIQ